MLVCMHPVCIYACPIPGGGQETDVETHMPSDRLEADRRRFELWTSARFLKQLQALLLFALLFLRFPCSVLALELLFLLLLESKVRILVVPASHMHTHAHDARAHTRKDIATAAAPHTAPNFVGYCYPEGALGAYTAATLNSAMCAWAELGSSCSCTTSRNVPKEE